MSDHPRPTRLSRLLARCYPGELREQYAEDIARFIDDARHDARYRHTPFATLFVSMRLSIDALFTLFSSLRGDLPSTTAQPSFADHLRSISMDAIMQDVRFALRGYIRRPAFTIVALATLMLGIGANSAIFTLLNAVLLRPLPYPHPEQLVGIWGKSGQQNQLLMSIPDVEDMRTRNRTFSEIGMVRSISVNLTGGDRPDRVVGSFINASSLSLLGAKTAVGRLFTPDETAVETGQQLVVISNATWLSRFGGQQDVLGKTMILNGRPHAIIGVTAAEFHDPFEAEVWLPLASAPNRQWFDRTVTSVWAVGRLKPGVKPEDGQKDLASIALQLEAEHPQNGTRTSVAVTDLREQLVGRSRLTLVVLFGAVVAVLLIVCVNLANLQLVRASTRAREISLRAALGASRIRLATQVFTESLLLSLAGGALGVLLGHWAVKLLAGMMTLSSVVTVSIDAKVLAFSFAVAVVTGLLFGAPAALFGNRANLQDALRARSDGASTRRLSARNVLVVAELSLCIVLLAVAGLFTRSLLSLQHINAGFDGNNVLTAEFRLPSVKYSDSVKVQLFMTSALERLREIPGVTSAALVGAVPLSGNFGSTNFVAQGQAEPAPGAAPVAQITPASDGYFATMRIPLLAGRDFDSHDLPNSEDVVIVNKVFADQIWPNESPIGKTIRLLGPPDDVVRVIGVVGPVKQLTLSAADAPQLYLSRAQSAGIFSSIVMRTTGDPDVMANALRGAIWAVDRDQPVWKVRSMKTLMTRDLAPATFSMTLVSAFAGLALVLAVIGVYGVMSFSVNQRTRELGIRMALGARGDQVLRLVLRTALEVVVVAVVLGVAGALAAGRYIGASLYNVGAADPVTMLSVPAILAAAALIACWLPARRAAHVDPAITLRTE